MSKVRLPYPAEFRQQMVELESARYFDRREAMPTPKVTMSKLRHTLQLLHGGALSTRQIGVALGISKFTVSEIASYARVAGVDWTLAQTLSAEELQARLYKPPVARESRHLEPGCTHIHRELRRPGVTLQLLWEEYQQQHAGQAYKYSAFCEKYKAWARGLKRSMRQTHEAGMGHRVSKPLLINPPLPELAFAAWLLIRLFRLEMNISGATKSPAELFLPEGSF